MLGVDATAAGAPEAPRFPRTDPELLFADAVVTAGLAPKIVAGLAEAGAVVVGAVLTAGLAVVDAAGAAVADPLMPN